MLVHTSLLTLFEAKYGEEWYTNCMSALMAVHVHHVHGQLKTHTHKHTQTHTRTQTHIFTLCFRLYCTLIV